MHSDKQFSIEIFPPKSPEGKINLTNTVNELNTLGPLFFSCTYGAGGSTRDTTKGMVLDMLAAGIDTAPHLSFGSDDEDTILALIKEYKAAGAKRIVALRGDIPAGMNSNRKLTHADELVRFIRHHTGNYFHIEVAAYPEIHPEAPSYEQDIRFLKGKFDAGANSGITQYFFNADAYFYFLEECHKQGIEQPIFPGIMPLTNFANIARFSANCGADIPRWLAKKLEGYGDDINALRAFGEAFITDMCERLLAGGAPGLHFYSMNSVEPVKTLWHNLGIEAACGSADSTVV
ncbi:MAG TPA: methylenetetrahydrofolate reductase [NAD(P)H] [Pseudomonadales bacterium]|nr:methylenetetrahydrofolate reductase [NAD(P)H] [Pseudomonadales bacterium]